MFYKVQYQVSCSRCPEPCCSERGGYGAVQTVRGICGPFRTSEQFRKQQGLKQAVDKTIVLTPDFTMSHLKSKSAEPV